MFVTSISIRREGYYGGYSGRADPSKPFLATIELHGSTGKVELNLAPAMSQKIVELIADEVAEAGRETAKALTAQCLEAKALPAAKAKA